MTKYRFKIFGGVWEGGSPLPR